MIVLVRNFMTPTVRLELLNRAPNALAAAACALLLQTAGACTFPTKRPEKFADDSAASRAAGDSGSATLERPDGGEASTGSSAPMNASLEAGVGPAAATTRSSSTPSSTNRSPQMQAGPDSGAPDDDAGVDEIQCAADLAACLLVDPLGYADCLRMNAEQHCTVADAVTPQVTTNDKGQPLSAACQAQLTDCIMQEPTPENAMKCQTAANTCTL